MRFRNNRLIYVAMIGLLLGACGSEADAPRDVEPADSIAPAPNPEPIPGMNDPDR